MNTIATPTANNQLAPAERKAGTERAFRLETLTSLRFFAAVAVLFSHAIPVFFPGTFESLEKIPLAQGVSFFFVLSGFILTYVHPRLETFSASAKFLRARVARIFPAHIATAALSLGTASFSLSHLNSTTWCILVSNILMLQSWIPQARFYYSLNAPAWSISTEFFFYLAFPLLIQNTPSKHIRNVLIGLTCLLTSITFAALLHLPEAPEASSMSMRALIYIHPMARLFEFCLGMSCAVIFKNLTQKNLKEKLDAGAASFLEIGIITSIIAYLLCIFDATKGLEANSWCLAAREWLLYDGNCFAFAALIILCALQKGIVSRLLNNKTLVWLGEISYSLYLLHFVFLSYYEKSNAAFSNYNPVLLLCTFLCLTIGAAHIMYTFVETPMRKWLRGSA